MNNKLPKQERNEKGHRIAKITPSIICSAVAECKHTGTGDIAKHLGLSQNGVLKALKDAEDAGLLTHDVINGNTYSWRVAELKECITDDQQYTKFDLMLSKFKRQSQATDLYVSLLLESPWDTQKLLELNAAIIRRWSITGLKTIKKDAWARCNGV